MPVPGKFGVAKIKVMAAGMRRMRKAKSGQQARVG
jgi:hypothetical protein